MHFDSFEMKLQEAHFTHGGSLGETGMLRMTLPLGERGYLKLRRESADNPQLMMTTLERSPGQPDQESDRAVGRALHHAAAERGRPGEAS